MPIGGESWHHSRTNRVQWSLSMAAMCVSRWSRPRVREGCCCCCCCCCCSFSDGEIDEEAVVVGAFGLRCMFASALTMSKGTFLLRISFLDDFARHCSSNQCEWRFLRGQRLMFSYCTFFASLSGAIICHAMQCAAIKLCLVTPVSVCVRASDERRKLDGHGYWFWCDQCRTTRRGAGAMRVAVRWDRFATAAMLCTCSKFLAHIRHFWCDFP